MSNIFSLIFKKYSNAGSAFSDFFTTSSLRERRKVLEEAARAANKEQKELVDRYNQKER